MNASGSLYFGEHPQPCSTKIGKVGNPPNRIRPRESLGSSHTARAVHCGQGRGMFGKAANDGQRCDVQLRRSAHALALAIAIRIAMPSS
jgi:hypothetical protein